MKLPYHIENNCDGSASVKFHATQTEADKDADLDEGWGEQCSGAVELKVEGGRLFFRDYVSGKYQEVWIEVKE